MHIQRIPKATFENGIMYLVKHSRLKAVLATKEAELAASWTKCSNLNDTLASKIAELITVRSDKCTLEAHLNTVKLQLKDSLTQLASAMEQV